MCIMLFGLMLLLFFIVVVFLCIYKNVCKYYFRAFKNLNSKKDKIKK